MTAPGPDVAAHETRSAAVDSPRSRVSIGRFSRLLLASHDSEGARAAERAAVGALEAGGSLRHLVIVPEFWQGMTGDGWRCNGSNVRDFADYLEGQIDREIREHLERVFAQARALGIVYSASSRHGPLAECLVAECRAGDYEAVVIGAPRPKRTLGFRSRMDLEKLVRALPVPVIVVPHPAAAAACR